MIYDILLSPCSLTFLKGGNDMWNVRTFRTEEGVLEFLNNNNLDSDDFKLTEDASKAKPLYRKDNVSVTVWFKEEKVSK